MAKKPKSWRDLPVRDKITFWGMTTVAWLKDTRVNEKPAEREARLKEKYTDLQEMACKYVQGVKPKKSKGQRALDYILFRN